MAAKQNYACVNAFRSADGRKSLAPLLARLARTAQNVKSEKIFCVFAIRSAFYDRVRRARRAGGAPPSLLVEGDIVSSSIVTRRWRDDSRLRIEVYLVVPFCTFALVCDRLRPFTTVYNRFRARWISANTRPGRALRRRDVDRAKMLRANAHVAIAVGVRSKTCRFPSLFVPFRHLLVRPGTHRKTANDRPGRQLRGRGVECDDISVGRARFTTGPSASSFSDRSDRERSTRRPGLRSA